MRKAIELLPELAYDEINVVDPILKDMTEEQARLFASVYRSRRKDPQIILLTTLMGFLGFAGVQRFLLNQMGMGILYFFTMGLCFVGTIVDLVNYREMALGYNRDIANEVTAMVKIS